MYMLNGYCEFSPPVHRTSVQQQVLSGIYSVGREIDQIAFFYAVKPAMAHATEQV